LYDSYEGGYEPTDVGSAGNVVGDTAFDADPSMASLKYRTVKLYDVLDDNPVLVYVVDAADNVVTSVAPRYTLICDILSVFVHDNCTDVPAIDGA
jgi:hypothetical protein